MAHNTLHLLVSSLAFLATLARGDLIAKKHNTLAKRDCPAGTTLCGSSGTILYCSRPGWKCCDTRHSAPLSATCCANGYYAPFGNYCCTDGSNCPNGRTCRGCTPANGDGGFIGSSVVAPTPVTTVPPVVQTTTRVLPVYTYYTFTVTYFYYQFYYIYVPSITRSTPASSAVTTTTTVTVYASNSADAQSSFNQISVTLALPTPSSATILPPLPSETPANASVLSAPARSSALSGPTSTSVNAASASSSQFANAGTRLWADGSSYLSLVAWVLVVAVGAIGFCVNLVL